MNDNEIIKALECCTSKSGCLECPLYNPEHTGTCVKSVFVNALGLINHQKAEIELLKLENKKLHETNNALNYQVDVWKPNEVLNEFLERLSIYVIPQKREGYNSDIVLKSTIDSLVKEMEEEHNEP